MPAAQTQANPADPAAILALEDVDIPSPHDPSLCLLRNVDWSVHPGECWLLHGPPGTGKTAFLQVAAALVRPTRGILRLFGTDIALLGEQDLLARRSKIGVVFSDGGRLFSHLTVLENVALPLLYHHPRPSPDQLAALEALLESLQLADYARQYPRTLTRAVAARTALARALVLQPDLLLLDEPGTGLANADLEWWMNFASLCRQPGAPQHPFPAPGTLVVAAEDGSPWRELATHSARLSTHDASLRPGPVLRPTPAA